MFKVHPEMMTSFYVSVIRDTAKIILSLQMVGLKFLSSEIMRKVICICSKKSLFQI